MEPEYIEIAMEIYGKRLPDTLRDILQRTEILCNKAGGSLFSRQVIATIISSWEARNSIL